MSEHHHRWKIRYPNFPRQKLLGYNILDNGYGYYSASPIYFGTNNQGRREDCWTRGNPGPPYRSGSTFLAIRGEDPKSYPEVSSPGVYQSTHPWIRYEGGFVPQYGLSSLLAYGSMGNLDSVTSDELASFGEADSFGATGWNLFRPDRPTADAAQFLGELKDVPRMLRDTAKSFHNLWRQAGGNKTNFGPKTVANDWLNTQFGWIPFCSDLSKFIKTYQNLEKQYARAVRYNGKWQKRGGIMREDTSSDKIIDNPNQTGHQPILTGYAYSDAARTGSHTVQRVTSDLVWWEGRMRYYVPNITGPEFRRDFENYAFGLTLSPSLVYELTPWSWLIDWFTNLGDVIENASPHWSKNLTAKYAFAMRKREISFIVDSTHDLHDQSLHNTWNLYYRTKSRAFANPFGFGLTWSDLTPRQLSILGALGLSRLPR